LGRFGHEAEARLQRAFDAGFKLQLPLILLRFGERIGRVNGVNVVIGVNAVNVGNLV